MLCFGADMRFGRFDQIIQSALRRIRQHSPLSWSHGDAEANSPALHLVSLLNSLEAGNRMDHGLLAVQEISGWGEVMHIGSSGFHGTTFTISAKKTVPPGALLGRGLLLSTESKLLAAHGPSPQLRLPDYFAPMAWVFQGLLNPFDSLDTVRFYLDRLDEQGCLLAKISIEEELVRMKLDFEE